MTWNGERYRHNMAAKGIKTKDLRFSSRGSKKNYVKSLRKDMFEVYHMKISPLEKYRELQDIKNNPEFKQKFIESLEKRPFKTERLRYENAKLVNTLIFSLPYGTTCLVCADCIKDCYASYREWIENVHDSRMFNLKASMYTPELLKKMLVNQLDMTSIPVVRIHESGDFYDQDYIDMWGEVAKQFKDKKFYAYTKVLDLKDENGKKLLDFSKLPSNVNIINSTINGEKNFGDDKYIDYMKKKYPNVYLCPDNPKDLPDYKNTKICGYKCKYCHTNKDVIFRKH